MDGLVKNLRSSQKVSDGMTDDGVKSIYELAANRIEAWQKCGNEIEKLINPPVIERANPVDVLLHVELYVSERNAFAEMIKRLEEKLELINEIAQNEDRREAWEAMDIIQNIVN